MAIAHFQPRRRGLELPIICVPQYQIGSGPGLSAGDAVRSLSAGPFDRAIKDWPNNVPLHEWKVRTLQACPRPVSVLTTTFVVAVLLARGLGCKGLLSGYGSVIEIARSMMLCARAGCGTTD